MPEKRLRSAVSLAKMLLDARERLAGAMRDAATARIAANPLRSEYLAPPTVSQRRLELHVDDLLYMICRDGPDEIEGHVRTTVEEIVRDILDSNRRNAGH